MVREARGELADAWEAYTTARDLYSRLGTNSEHSGYKTVRQSISQVEKAIMKQNHERLALGPGQKEPSGAVLGGPFGDLHSQESL
jgi:hypothetical protein